MKIKKCHVIEYDPEEIQAIDILIRKKKHNLKTEQEWLEDTKRKSEDTSFSEKQVDKLKKELEALLVGKKGIMCEDNRHEILLFDEQLRSHRQNKKVKEFSEKFHNLRWE